MHKKSRFFTPYLASLLAIAVSLSACAQQAVRQDEGADVEVAAQSVPGQDAATAIAQVKELKLSNGMTVLLRENHAAPTVSWLVFYKVGSANEGPGMTGASHLLEHMLFKGTRQFRKGQIAQVLGRNGARFNATTSEDFTNYFETYSSDRLDLGLMIEADRMRNATILDTERQAEMTVVRNELERGENNPEYNLWDAVRASAFQSHGYHHPVIGYRSDVEGISTQRLKQIYDTYYHPGNAVGVLVGDFRTPHAISLIKQYFEPIPAGPKPPENYTAEEPQVGERRVTLRRWGETSIVSTAYHIPAASSKDTAPLALVESILSQGVNARLRRTLVDGGLATRASAYAEAMKDPGLFWLTATVRPGVSHRAVEDALNAEIDKLRTTPVGAADLRIAKNQAEAAYAYRSDGTSGTGWALGQWAMIDKWQRFYELLGELRNVTAKDIQDVASRYLVQDNRTVGWYVGTKDVPRTVRQESDKAKATPTRKQYIERFPTQPWEARPAPIPPVSGLQIAKLDNGLTVAVLKNDANATVAVDGYVKVGSIFDRAENSGRYGLAELTAEMLDKGTAKRSKAKLARDLEVVGATMHFRSGTEQTTFQGKAVNKDWNRLLEAMVEAMAAPAFPEDELKLARDLKTAAIQQNDEQPSIRAHRVLMQRLYPEGHPYFIPGPERAISELKAIGAADLRNFHKRFYGPNVTAISVVGNVEPEAVIQRVKELTATWPRALDVDVDRQIMGWNIPENRSAAPIVETMLDKSNVEIRIGQVSNLRRVGAPGVHNSDYYAAKVMNWILGGSTLTGRLGLKLRDELGLTYGTGCHLSAGRVPGPWIANVTVNRQNVGTAYGALVDVVRTFLKDGPTEDEVADAKGALIGQQAVALSSNAGLASSLSDVLFFEFDARTYWSQVPREYGKVSVEKTRAAAIKYVNLDHAITVIAGPYDDRAGGLAGNSAGENLGDR